MHIHTIHEEATPDEEPLRPKSGAPKDVFDAVHAQLQQRLTAAAPSAVSLPSLTTRVNIGKTLKELQEKGAMPEDQKVAKNTLAAPLIAEMWKAIAPQLADTASLEKAIEGIGDSFKIAKILKERTWNMIETATIGWLASMQTAIAGKKPEEYSDTERLLVGMHEKFIGHQTVQERIRMAQERYKSAGEAPNEDIRKLLEMKSLPQKIEHMPPKLTTLFGGMKTAYDIVWAVMENIPLMYRHAEMDATLEQLKKTAGRPSWDLIEKIGSMHLAAAGEFGNILDESASKKSSPFAIQADTGDIMFATPDQTVEQIVESTLASKTPELMRDPRTGCPAFVGGKRSPAFQFYDWIRTVCEKVYFPRIAELQGK